MSPRRKDPATRQGLMDVAARLLAQDGPQAMTTRRIASEAGTSTMAVYTYFGNMSGLVREMVNEGFARLARNFEGIGHSADPVADLALFGRAYRHTAVTEANLYAVMFGGRSLAGFELSEEDRQRGRYTMAPVIECVARCVDAGRFRQADHMLVAHHMWLATHGVVTLEIGGYLVEPCDADLCFETQLVTLMVGAGDTFEAASTSVACSAERLPEVLDRAGGAPSRSGGSGRARLHR